MIQFPSNIAVSTPEKMSMAGMFVSYVMERIQKENSFSARLKRADNLATEYQSWELLASFSVDLENDCERIPYCTVGAALARTQPKENGTLPLGAAIAACFREGYQSEQAKVRLRSLLACTSIKESCHILRPLLMLMASRGVTPDFVQLLEQLLEFSGESQVKIRACWAKTFYRQSIDDSDRITEKVHD
ncbi:type I-E CRISPR-associated protein Cse2/CasB [Candidatus Pantoea multigeneris]|uniref:Type I-E CRISPR-associated protein Cse2/CasB n=1 Tax=Candidatus Pantoea multigeneris TaxID=2608357 RepID=A0ABX0RFA2_9GAMM|nr:type I-E CRISPR-associated protein Cse2/CasB [Pantoea multigeneris]NIF24016.1 type I-E CRISPR-associated protein Cse2/CasB [Pantoea multigeneris]